MPTLQAVVDLRTAPEQPAKIDFDRGTIAVEPLEVGDPPRVAVRVRVAADDRGSPVVNDRVTSITGCDILYFGMDPILVDDEFVIVDARLDCLVGSEVVRGRTEHTVVAVAVADGRTNVLHTGHSEFHDNRGLAVSSTRLEFYVEADELAVYRHDVAWCDREGLRMLLDDPSLECARRSRTLEQIKRIHVGDALESEEHLTRGRGVHD